MDITESDEELVARYVDDGDPTAFKDLMERYFEKVSRIAASILGKRHTADVDDVVQDIFVRIHRGISSFRGESRFSTWVYRVAFNQSNTHKKRISGRLDRVTFDSLSQVHSSEADPADLMDNDQLRLILDNAIDRLPSEYQSAVRLYYWFGVPVAEIAEQFAAPENTIKSWLHRARKLLAHDLKKQDIRDEE